MLNPQEGFQLVTNRKKCKSRKSINIKSSPLPANVNLNSNYTLRRLADLRKEIVSSEIFTNCVQQVCNCLKILKRESVEQLVCFGIGSFATCLIALHQLAFILELIDKLQIKDIKFYDPVLHDEEKQILVNLDCKIIPENCEGKYTANCITVFYLPHCPKQLTNNLLWKNWSMNNLANIIIIGNSFENMRQNSPERLLKEDAEYVLRSSDWVTEIPLVNDFQYGDVFNDTSVHIFTEDKLQQVPDKEWLDNIEPKYKDSEMITAELEEKLLIR